MLNNPVIDRPMNLKFQRAERVGNVLMSILKRMGEIIHWINAPLVSRIMVILMQDPINNWISHVHVGRSHVNLGP